MGRKIWIFNHYATDMYKNQGGRHYWFAENLNKKGFETTVFCANTFHNSNSYISTSDKKYSSRESGNIPFVFVKTTTALGNGLDRVKNMSLFYLNLLSVAKQYAKTNGKPDVIIASSVHPLTMVAGIQISRKFGIPCICEIRDLWPEAIFAFNKAKENSLLGRILINGEKWIYKNADALIFTKEGDSDYIKERKWDLSQGGAIDLKKAHYINNGVDIDAFEKSSGTNQLSDSDVNGEYFNVVYVGAIRPVNNVGNILDAAIKLKSNNDIVFLIYGDGNQKEELEKRVKEEGLGNVKIKGFIEKKYVPFILSKSSVNILNYSQSKYNWSRGNSSNKLFEYMASGKPIISTVKMGYSIIEKYQCGIELENASGEELAEAIMSIKALPINEYNRIGKNAKDGAKEFDFEILTSKLIEVINSVTEVNRND